jgi:hypothetical protein
MQGGHRPLRGAALLGRVALRQRPVHRSLDGVQAHMG